MAIPSPGNEHFPSIPLNSPRSQPTEANCWQTGYLFFGTGCSTPLQVLRLARLPELDGFGSLAAIRELRRVFAGSTGLATEKFQSFRCGNNFLNLREQVSLNPPGPTDVYSETCSGE